MLRGAPRGNDMSRLKVAHLSTLGEFERVYTSSQSKVDLAKVCGGEGRASQVAARRHARAGPNFDLVLGVDLTRRDNRSRVLRCFAR
eukprot:1694513-Alexandrium_andersonii.AAC.1